jgi:hypothetical protein
MQIADLLNLGSSDRMDSKWSLCARRYNIFVGVDIPPSTQLSSTGIPALLRPYNLYDTSIRHCFMVGRICLVQWLIPGWVTVFTELPRTTSLVAMRMKPLSFAAS